MALPKNKPIMTTDNWGPTPEPMTVSCPITDDVVLLPNQSIPCHLHTYHRLRSPTLEQSIEAIIYTHSMTGHSQKRDWRKALAKDIALFLRAKNLEPQEGQ